MNNMLLYIYCVFTDAIILLYTCILSINGIPACANKKLLTDILKTEWGFTGNRLNNCIAFQNVYYLQ